MKYLIFIFLVFNALFGFSQQSDSINKSKTVIYLIPGLGADYNLYNNLKLDSSYDTIHVKRIMPEKHETLKAYSERISNQIDTTNKFILVGVSLGGMIATELAENLNPEKVIIISSAKNRNELPWHYKFMKVVPINKIIPAGFIKMCSFVAQPLVEPDRNKEKETFKQMLKDVDAKTLKRSINLIINWDRDNNYYPIAHIHGTKDHTLPIKNVSAEYIVDKGSHMMILTQGSDLSVLINCILKNK